MRQWIGFLRIPILLRVNPPPQGTNLSKKCDLVGRSGLNQIPETRILDLDGSPKPGEDQKPCLEPSLQGFEVDEAQIIFRGLCPDCAKN